MINSFNIFDYEDIQLIPAKCVVKSRKECDTSVKLGKLTFKMPVVPSNMQTVIDEDLALLLAKNNYFYIMHRFQPDNRLQFVEKMQAAGLYASISIGVKPAEYELLKKMKQAKLQPEYITIDIAHGHADTVMQMIGYLKENFPESFVIAGNVATPEAVRDLENAGADATKVGIGPGKVCITKLKTGFGTGGWQLSALNWCQKAANKPIIADGGIRQHGDIAKSIRFGATMVMIGSLFSGHQESPGEVIEKEGKYYKPYYGSASEFQKGTHENVEGKKIYLPLKGSIMDTLTEMQQDLQSAISYAGGRSLGALKLVDYAIVKNSIFNGDY